MLKVKNKSVAQLIDKFVGDGVGIDSMMVRFRNSVIVHVLAQTDGNISHAARVLKTGRESIYRWLREYKIEEDYVMDEESQRREIPAERNPQLH